MMCCGRSPEGPGADPAGKLRRHLATRSGANSGGGGKAVRAAVCGRGPAGCTARSWRTASGVAGANPVESRAAQALPSNPSRAKATARPCLSSTEGCFRLAGGGGRVSQREARSPSCQ